MKTILILVLCLVNVAVANVIQLDKNQTKFLTSKLNLETKIIPLKEIEGWSSVLKKGEDPRFYQSDNNPYSQYQFKLSDGSEKMIILSNSELSSLIDEKAYEGNYITMGYSGLTEKNTIYVTGLHILYVFVTFLVVLLMFPEKVGKVTGFCQGIRIFSCIIGLILIYSYCSNKEYPIDPFVIIGAIWITTAVYLWIIDLLDIRVCRLTN